MNKRFKKTVAWVAILTVATGAGAYAIGSAVQDDDETETAITGDALTKASAAALAHTGGGQVSGTEVGDEESYYEVEVTLADGSQVDVQLNEDFEVVGSESDDESEDPDGE